MNVCRDSTEASVRKPANRIELEGAVCEAAIVSSIAVTLMEDALQPTVLLPEIEGYKSFLLTQGQWDDLAWAIGEAALKAREARETFYAMPTARAA